MLQVLEQALEKNTAHSLQAIDLPVDPPPWYDEAIYRHLWSDEHQTNSPSIEYMQRHCAILNQADYLVIAAPVWNQFVPAIYKAWIDLIIAPDHTYRFGPDGIIGLHQLKEVLFLISSGGEQARINVDNHLLHTLLSPFNYIGVPECHVIWADGQEPALYANHAERLESACEQVVAHVNRW